LTPPSMIQLLQASKSLKLIGLIFCIDKHIFNAYDLKSVSQLFSHSLLLKTQALTQLQTHPYFSLRTIFD